MLMYSIGDFAFSFLTGGPIKAIFSAVKSIMNFWKKDKWKKTVKKFKKAIDAGYDSAMGISKWQAGATEMGRRRMLAAGGRGADTGDHSLGDYQKRYDKNMRDLREQGFASRRDLQMADLEAATGGGEDQFLKASQMQLGLNVASEAGSYLTDVLTATDPNTVMHYEGGNLAGPQPQMGAGEALGSFNLGDHITQAGKHMFKPGLLSQIGSAVGDVLKGGATAYGMGYVDEYFRSKEMDKAYDPGQEYSDPAYAGFGE